MRRFINADILHGAISDSTSLNRYSYVNGNPVSYVDPFGLEAERGNEPFVYEVHNRKTWQELGFLYDGTMRDFKRLEQGLPPYAYISWLKTHPYYGISYYFASGSVGNSIASASGMASIGNAYAGVIDTGWGVAVGVSGASAESDLTFINLGLNSKAEVLSAEANAQINCEEGIRLGAEAKATVATAEVALMIDLFLIEIQIGANADFLSAGAEASIGASFNDEGEFEISAEAGVGAGLFGAGIDLAIIFG